MKKSVRGWGRLFCRLLIPLVFLLCALPQSVWADDTPVRIDEKQFSTDSKWYEYALPKDVYMYCPFQLESNGKLELKVQTNFSALHYVTLLDDNQEVVDKKSVFGKGSAEPQTTEFNYHLTAGKYYVRVESWNDCSGLFRIRAGLTAAETNETEPNDTLQTAMTLPVNGDPVHAFLSSACTDAFYGDPIPEELQDMTDYFRFTVTDGTWDIRIAPLEEDPRMHVVLYRSDRSQIWSEYPTKYLQKLTELSAGTYYLMAESNGSRCGAYSVYVGQEEDSDTSKETEPSGNQETENNTPAEPDPDPAGEDPGTDTPADPDPSAGFTGSYRSMWTIEDDTWSFSNTDDKVDMKYFRNIYGKERGKQLYDQYNKHDFFRGTYSVGLCNGMVVAASAINWQRSPSVSSFGGASKLSQVNKKTKSTATGQNAMDYIKHAEIIQSCPEVLLQEIKNEGKLTKLTQAVEAFCRNLSSSPVCLSVIQENGGAHALWPLGIDYEKDETRILVYDCNYPKKEGRVILKKTNGAYTSWSYTDQGGTSYSGKVMNDCYLSGGTITYSHETEIFVHAYATRPNYVTKDYQLLILDTESPKTPVILDDRSDIIPMNLVGSTGGGLAGYWVPASAQIDLEEIPDGTSVILADDRYSVAVNPVKGSSLSLSMDQKGNCTVTADSSLKGTAKVTLYDAGSTASAAAKERVFALSGSGEITLSGKSGKIEVQGADSLTAKIKSGAEDSSGKISGKVASKIQVKNLSDSKAYQFSEESGKLVVRSAKKGSSTFKTKVAAAVRLKKGTKFKVGALTYQITSLTSKKKTVKVTKAANKSSIKVPSTVSQSGSTFKVTAIGSKAFQKLSKLKTVTIGKKIETIGSKAFYKCKKLKKITVSGKSLKKVGKNALQGIYKKAVIKVPSSKKKAYTRLFKNKGQGKKVKIK